MKKSYPDPILLGTGMLISLLVVIALPEFYFHKDLQVLWEWAQIWKTGWREIYINCPMCNYPILGMFSSAGLLSFFGGFDYKDAALSFRLLLSIIDGFNVWLIFRILSMLKVPRPACIAGVIGISMSSWIGGALWGQIDGISQSTILMLLAWIVNKNTTATPVKFPPHLYTAISAFLLGCILLSKQLTIFSAISLGFLLAVDILFQYRSWKSFLASAALALGVFLATLLAWDPFLALKKPYFSHLLYIWQEGIFQAGIISGNGFNIWMLLGRSMWSSAHLPLFDGLSWLNPYRIGQILFIFLTGVFSLSLILHIRVAYLRRDLNLNREILLNFILHLALINLCFNVFLTGTRERYLFHFYPFIIIACSGLAAFDSKFSKNIGPILLLGSNIYGIFVLQILSTIDFRIGMGTHLFLSMFHVILFAWLMVISLRYQDLFANLARIFRKSPNNLPTVR